MTRLINQVDTLQRLLEAVAAVPAGQRLHVPALRDALVNQADVLTGLQMLVCAGELDPATLRPPAPGQINPLEEKLAELVPSPPPSSIEIREGMTGHQLLEILEAEGARRGLSRCAVGFEAFNNNAQLYTLAKGTRPARRSTIDKVAAWLGVTVSASEAAGPDDCGRADPGPASPPAPPPTEAPPALLGPAAPAEVPDLAAKPSGNELADALCKYASDHDLAILRVGKHLFNGPNTVRRLRSVAVPQQATVDKVRAFLAGPPPAELTRKESGGPRVAEVGGITGAALAAEVDELIAREKLSITAVGLHLFANRSGIQHLRRSNPRQATVDKVRAFLAAPPLDQLRPKIAPAPAEAPQPPREPPAVTSQAAKSQVIRRGNTKQAERLIERQAAGETVRNVSPMVRATASAIKARRESEARQVDPIERAKLALQRKGNRVFAAEVSEGPSGTGYFYVGQRRVSKAELLLMAGQTIDVAPAAALPRPISPSPLEHNLPPAMKPAEIAWCDQCDQRVSGARVAKCQSRFCSLKKANAA